jgi:hypothetical protein
MCETTNVYCVFTGIQSQPNHTQKSLEFSFSQKHFCAVVAIVNDIKVRGWSEKFSALNIDGNTTGKIFFPKLVHLL